MTAGHLAKAMVVAAAGSAALLFGDALSAQTPRKPILAAPVASSATAADDDARRGAARRLLLASRFRERQAVLLADALRTARAAMADECVERAAAGRDMAVCEAIAKAGAAMGPRLAAEQSSILDEIVAANETIYARHFTVAEMDEITRFFRTPVGQRYGAAYPQILDEVRGRRRVILRRYLIAAASADRKTP